MPCHGASTTAASRCSPVHLVPHDLALVSPIILYDHPEIAEQSKGALFDSTEIDEILTLRVMTMTDDEKAQARATDPLAARIIDRCDSMSPEAMLDLHGVLRNPHAAAPDDQLIPEIPEGVDWWDPLADNAVRPELDADTGQRHAGDPRQPGPAAAVAQGRRPGPLLRRQDRARHLGARGRRRRSARRRRHRGRSGCRPARLVWPLPVLRTRRGRTTHRKEFEMEVVGWVAVGVVAVVVLGGACVGVMSIPDASAT